MTGIAVHRSHAEELGDLAAIEFPEFRFPEFRFPEFRQLRQKRADGNRPEPLNGFKDFDFVRVRRVGFDAFGQTPIARRRSIVSPCFFSVSSACRM